MSRFRSVAPSRSLRTQLLLAVTGAIVIGVLASSLLMSRLSHVLDGYADILGHEVAMEQDARNAQVRFKIQVQEWKNVLLRGHDPDDLEKYWSRFRERHADVQRMVAGVEQRARRPEVASIAREFGERHRALLTAYTASQEGFRVHFDPKIADTAVRGIDRAPTDLLDALVQELAVADVSAAQSEQAARERWLLILAMVFLYALVLAGGWFLTGRIVRSVVDIRATIGALSRGDLSHRSRARGRDELGETAAAMNHLAERLQHHLVEPLHRVAEGELDVRLDRWSGEDQLTPALQRMVRTLRELRDEMSRLTTDAQAGVLSTRGDWRRFRGEYAEIVSDVNEVLEAMLSPVQASSTVIDALSRGDLTQRVEGEFTGDHALLRDRVNRTSEELGATLARIGAESARVARSASELERSASTVREHSGSAWARSRDVGHASEEMSQTVTVVAGAAEQLEASVAEIEARMRASVEQQSEATRNAGEVAEIIAELGRASEEIGTVIGVVTEITEQTHTLALNATIEAARAGDAGRGFAVVATEVKQLAGHTARATQDISARVGRIQERTYLAVEGVERLNQVIAAMSENGTSIATSLRQQADAVSEVARSAAEANLHVRNVTERLSEIGSAAQGSSAAGESVDHAAAELARVAGALDELVQRFQLPTGDDSSGAASVTDSREVARAVGW